MRYIDAFDAMDESEEPLVIHRHGSSPGRALIVLLHGLGGHRYRTWTPKRKDPCKIGLARFLYEDVGGVDIGLYAYRTLLGRLKFWKSIPLDREAVVLADRIRDQSRVYKTVILAGHSMGGILAKAAVRELIERPDAVTLSAIRALLLLATPQAGSRIVPKVLWRLTEDGRVLRTHGELVTRIQRMFMNQVVADPTPAKPNAFVIPAFVVAAAEDNWVDAFSSGLNVSGDRTNTVRGSHTSAVKPTAKTDDAYQWLRERIREIVEPETLAAAAVPANQEEALRDELVQLLQSAFTRDELKFCAPHLGIRLDELGSGLNTAHRDLVVWALAKGRVRALVRMMIEERNALPGVRTFAERHPAFGSLLTSDERELLRQCLTDSSLADYGALRRFGMEAMLVDLNDFLSDAPSDADSATPHIESLLRTADFVGQVEALVRAVLKRLFGPVAEGKLGPLLNALQTRRTQCGPSDSPFDICDLQGKLFIDRAPFRQALRELTSDDGALRVVAIDGPTRSGKSHSKYLVEYLERLGRYDKALISLEDETPATYTPDVLIATIVERTGGNGQNLNLKKTRSETRDRWIARLANQLLNHVKQCTRSVLLVLDGFDQPSLRPETRSLVQQLLKRAATEVRLRIVLLGYQRDLLPQEVSGRVAVEPITGFTQDDLRRFFVQYARDRGKDSPAPAVIDVFVQDVISAVPQANPTPECNEAVAKVVEVWAERLRTLT